MGGRPEDLTRTTTRQSQTEETQRGLLFRSMGTRRLRRRGAPHGGIGGMGGMVFGTRNFSDRSSGSGRSAEHEVGGDQKDTPDTPHPPAEVEVTGSALSLGSRTSRLAIELLRLT